MKALREKKKGMSWKEEIHDMRKDIKNIRRETHQIWNYNAPEASD